MDDKTANEYVRMDARFRLRGWQGQPHAIVDTLTANAFFVSKGVFDTLSLCNGKFRPKDPVFIGAMKSHLALLRREGMLAFSDEPSSLDPGQKYVLYPNHHMRQVQWSITGRCNYRCRHCFMSAPHAALPEPTTDECLQIVDQMAEAGVLVVKITGGEPLVHPGFLKIVDRLCEHGIPIATILTNGALVDERLLDFFEERGLTPGFDVSFDGIGWHDWLRGVDGAEEATLRALALCRDRAFPAGVQYVLHRRNAGALRETVNTLGALGVMGVLVGAVRDMGEARGMRDDILSEEEAFDIARTYLPQFLEDGCPVPKLTIGNFQVENGRVSLTRGKDRGPSCTGRAACGTIRQTMYLSSDGYILPCIPSSEDQGLKERFPNLRDTTISEALAGSSYLDAVSLTVGDVFELNPECQSCTWRTRCLGGCRAKSVNEDGSKDFRGLDRRACAYFRGGKYERDLAFLESLDVPVAPSPSKRAPRPQHL